MCQKKKTEVYYRAGESKKHRDAVEAKCNVRGGECVWRKAGRTTESAYFTFTTMLNALLSDDVPHVEGRLGERMGGNNQGD